MAFLCGTHGLRAFAVTTTLPDFTNVWEKAHLYVVDKDTNSVFINANEKFLATLAPKVQTSQDLVGKTDFDFYPTDLANAYRSDDQRVISGGVTLEVVEKHEAPGEAPSFVHTTKIPLKDASGIVQALRVIFYDIPEPGQTTLPVFSTEWLRANAVSIDKDTNSVFLNANEKFLATLRPSFPEILTVTNLIGRDDYYFYPPDLAEKFRADDRQVMTRGIAFETIEDNQPIGGTRTTYQVAKIPLRGPDGTVVGVRILSWEVPQIHLERAASSLDVSFPKSADGFVVQRSLAISNTMVWESIPATSTNASSVSVAVSPGAEQSYYRLKLLQPEAEEWIPDRPITLVVPFAAGGSTYQLAKLLATNLQAKLGQKIFVVTLPGNSGATGTGAVLTAPRDGYTWLVAASANIGLYKLTGLLETQLSDWTCFLPVQLPQIFSVGAQSPYKSFDQFLAAFKAKPGVLKVGTAGRTSSGAVAMQLLQHATDIQFVTVAFNGGAEAAAALASGQVDVMAQTFSDASALMLGGQILPLATLSAEPLVVQGLPAPIPPVGQWVPGLSANGNYFGFYLPKGTPANEIRTVQRIWDEVVPNSVEIKDYALREGAVFSPVSGASAQLEALKYLSVAAWSLYDTRQILISPEQAGIPRPSAP